MTTHLEDVVDVQDEVEDVEREPGEREDDDDGDQEGVGSSLALQLVLEPAVLLLLDLVDVTHRRRSRVGVGVDVDVGVVLVVLLDDDALRRHGQASLERRRERLAQSTHPVFVLQKPIQLYFFTTCKFSPH